jgi:hypothetical protein
MSAKADGAAEDLKLGARSSQNGLSFSNNETFQSRRHFFSFFFKRDSDGEIC